MSELEYAYVYVYVYVLTIQSTFLRFICFLNSNMVVLIERID